MPKRPRALTRTVVALGLVSLCTDAATEMAIPLLPVFLATLTTAPALALGVVEGAADAVAAVMKLLSGAWSDRSGRRRPWVLGGYTLSGLSRPLLAVAFAPWQVVAIRVVDRVGKGLRSSARDALLAAEATPETRGFVFGFHRGMDHVGAVLGPLLALGVLALSGGDLRLVFALTLVPGALATLAILGLVRERRTAPTEARVLLGELRPLWRLLVPFGLFALGNASDVFLLLKAGGSRAPLTTLPLLWILLHVVKSVSSPLGGRLVDKVGPRRVLLAGWLYYCAVYVGFGLADEGYQMWILFVAYGVFHGLTEPAEKTLVARAVPDEARGSAFGSYYLVTGLAALPASVAFGAVWELYGATVAFFAAAGLALAAAAALLTLRPARPAAAPPPARG